MSKYRLSAASLAKLEGVHPDLQRVIRRAIEITPIDFKVIEGVRTPARQKELVAKGASQTMNSRHIPAKNGFGHAVDIVPLTAAGQVSWDWPLYYKLAPAVKQAAKELGVPVEWGGDWSSFKDGPHWQLPWKPYDGNGAAPSVAAAAPIAPPTEKQVTATVAAGGTAAGLAGMLALVEPLRELVAVIEGQAPGFSSGDLVQGAVGLAAIAGAVATFLQRWAALGRPLPW